jgi:hypothetical protein
MDQLAFRQKISVAACACVQIRVYDLNVSCLLDICRSHSQPQARRSLEILCALLTRAHDVRAEHLQRTREDTASDRKKQAKTSALLTFGPDPDISWLQARPPSLRRRQSSSMRALYKLHLMTVETTSESVFPRRLPRLASALHLCFAPHSVSRRTSKIRLGFGQWNASTVCLHLCRQSEAPLKKTDAAGSAGARRQTILFRRAEDLLACMERLLDDPEVRS